MLDKEYGDDLRAGMEATRAPDWKRHAIRLTALPPGDGPYERWELMSEFTGEILLQGPMPIDQGAIRAACDAFHRRIDADAV